MIKLILSLLVSLNAYAITNVDKQEIFSKNILTNAGFESSKSGWSSSAGTFAVTTTSPMVGAVHATWDAAANANTLTGPAITIPAGMFGRNSIGSCLIKTPSGTATHTLQVYDGTNVVSSVTIVSNTTPVRSSVNFISPSSGTLTIRILANADEPSISIDDCYIGPAEGYNLNSVSQAEVYGIVESTGIVSCAWTVQNAAYTSFSADTDCNTATAKINASAPSTKIPAITFVKLPPGRYLIKAIGGFNISGGNQVNHGYRFTDGTNNTLPAVMYNGGATAPGGTTIVEGYLEYTTTQSNITIQMQALSASTDTARIDNPLATTSFQIIVIKYPTSADTALAPDTVANSWSGYHDNTCSWARTNTAYGDPTADASCALVERTNQNFGTVSTSGSVLPAITFTPKRAGRYYVCAYPKITGGSITAVYDVRLTDGTTVIVESQHTVGVANEITVLPLCGVYVATNISAVTLSLQTKATSGSVTIAPNSTNTSALEWSIFQVDQSFPMPTLVNSLVSSSSGVTSVEVAKLNCDAASSITSQHGLWVSSIGNISAGACAVTLTSGIFSATPYCTATPALAGGITTGQELNVDATSSTAVSVDCEDDASTACTVADFVLNCIGPK